ncbi:MAG: D-alanyl-D-alanine carboxypeptidase [Clostridia bacterium]|nr:D-alanyl-D-alanine carboxypeptidase [Clostridia bacterium]
MKKILSILISLILILPLTANTVCAVYEESVNTVVQKTDTGITVNARSAVLMDASTGQVLFSANEHERLYPASVTKIMPLLLFMEALDEGRISLEDTVTASPTAASKGGSQIWLKEGEQMTVDELLRATAIASANDACTALGEHIAGNEEAFVSLMNKRAKELGMENTNFVNCSGLDDDTTEHLTTAYDVALMSKELLSHDRIRTYTTVWMDTLRNGATELTNTNRLVRFYSGTTGLKTGTTSKAGYCLSASAERDGLHLIAVILGAQTSDDRFEGAKALLNYGFANFETVRLSFEEAQIPPVKVIRGLRSEITAGIKDVFPVTLSKGEADKIEYTVEIAENVQAPVEKNQILGKVTAKAGDNIIGQYSLIAEDGVRKLTIFDCAERFLKSLTKSA